MKLSWWVIYGVGYFFQVGVIVQDGEHGLLPNMLMALFWPVWVPLELGKMFRSLHERILQ
jgi:hypothetical protein